MHLRVRRILSALFFLVFIVAAPAIIVSTAGYRYNFVKGRLERTGVMFISTKPSNAKIFLNGKEEKSETPTRIRRLLPGKYEVRIEKEGYHPWVRTVEVRSRETSFLNNLALFRQGVPELALELPIRDMHLSEDGRYAALLSEQESVTEVHLVDLKSGETHLPYRTENASGADVALAWSKDSERLLIQRTGQNGTDFLIWNEDLPDEVLNLRTISAKPYVQAFWSEEGRFLYAASDRQLYLIDPRTRTTQEVGPAVPNMTILPFGIFGVFRDGPETVLVRRSREADTFDVLGPVPSGNYRFVNGSHLGLLDETQGRLLIIDPASTPNELNYFEARAEHAKWSEDNGQVLYWTNLELHTYDPSTNVDRLVTRLGTSIVDASWFPGFELLLFADPESVQSVEGADFLTRNVTEIARFTSIKAFEVTPSGNEAWFSASIGGQEGLWKVRIR